MASLPAVPASPTLLLAVVLAGTAAAADPTGAGAPSPGAGAPPAGDTVPYDRAAADRDVDLVLEGSGLDLVRARGRLRRAPAVAAEAVEARLATVATPRERQRLLAVLADLGAGAAADTLADHYRTQLAGLSGARQLEQARAIRKSLSKLPDVRLAVSVALAGATDLPPEVRAVFVAELAAAIPAERGGELVAHLGARDPVLRAALRRATIRRLRRDRMFRQSWTKEANARLDGPASAVGAQVLLVYAGLDGAPEGAVERAFAWALDPAAPLPARVAAVELVGRHGQDAARGRLAPLVARAAPDRAPARGDEILARAALAALPRAAAANAVRAAGLHGAADPKLAALAHRLAPLPAAEALAAGTAPGFPEVRAAALDAVAAPCPRDAVRRLARLVRPPWRGGDPDDQVARAALRALGRCGGRPARRAVLAVLRDTQAPTVRRVDAARVALARFGDAGLDAVLDALERTDDPKVAADLVAALAAAPRPTARLVATVCAVARHPGPAAPAARRTLSALGAPSCGP